MHRQTDDNGLLTVLMERYEKQRLPRILAMQAKVARGEPLVSFDIQYLQEVAASVNELRPFLNRHPECNTLATHLVNLCADVAQKGVSIEQRH